MKLLPILIISALFLISCSPKDYSPHVLVGDAKVTVDLANTPELRAAGLMYQERLGEDRGMLFLFDAPGKYKFWMKDTRIALDIIFIDKDKKVVDILQADPCTEKPCPLYTPTTPVLYALEVDKGYAAEYNIHKGDTVIFRNIKEL